MSNLVPLASGSALARPRSRRARQALTTIDNQLSLDIAGIETTAELQVTRVQAVGYVGKRALQEVAMVSQLEQQLATLVPMAAGRLQAIGDMVALEAADVIADTVRRLR